VRPLRDALCVAAKLTGRFLTAFGMTGGACEVKIASGCALGMTGGACEVTLKTTTIGGVSVRVPNTARIYQPRSGVYPAAEQPLSPAGHLSRGA
jgi:hypothetical protein